MPLLDIDQGIPAGSQPLEVGQICLQLLLGNLLVGS